MVGPRVGPGGALPMDDANDPAVTDPASAPAVPGGAASAVGDPGPGPGGPPRGTTRAAAGLPELGDVAPIALPEDAGRFARLVHQVRTWGGDRAAAIERQWPQTAMVWELYRRFKRLNGTVLAGHLAFRLFLVLLPLLVLLVGVAGLAQNSGVDVQSQIGETVDMSSALSSSIRQGLGDAEQGRWGLFFTGVFGLILASLSLLSAVYYGFAQAWDIRVEKIEHRWSIFVRFLGAFLLFDFFFLGTSRLRKAGLLLSVTGSLVAISVFGLATLALGLAMPRRARGWVWLLPGSVFSAAAYLALQVVMVHYLPDKLARSSQLYGGLGVAAALLFLLLLISDIIILSAFVNAVWWDHFHPDGADHESGVVVRRIEELAGRVAERAPRRARQDSGEGDGGGDGTAAASVADVPGPGAPGPGSAGTGASDGDTVPA